MFNKVTVDLITHNADKSEYALYLVEDMPWSDVESRVKIMQDRIYTAMDAVLDGQLASDYPDSKGKKVRVEVICRGANPPNRFREVVGRLAEIIRSESDYGRDIGSSVFISSMRLTYGERSADAQ